MANTMKALSTVTVGAGGVSYIDFTNIPQTYTDFIVKFSSRGSDTATFGPVRLFFNGGGTSLLLKAIYGYNGSVGAENLTQNRIGYTSADGATANTFGSAELYVPNYVSNNFYKASSGDGVSENNSSTAAVTSFNANLSSSNSPITSIRIFPDQLLWKENTTATLYGVFNQEVSSVPATPTIGTATGANQSASITFTEVTGAASYTMTSTPGSITATGTSSPVTVTGLTNGTSYTFTVKANNPLGSSADSAASNSVTPAVPAANTPMGYVTTTETAAAMKRFPYTTETYSAISQVAKFGDYANADNSPYDSYKFGNGGSLTAGGNGNGIFKFGFFAETASVLTAVTTYSFFNAGGATNNGIAAYIAGGMNTDGTGGLSTSNKMPYSTETPALLSTTLATARGAFGGVYNANTAAYFTGGTINNGGTQYNIISKMTFSNDTLSTLGATLGTAVAINPTTNSTHASTAGFVFGGYVGPSGQDTGVIQKLTFSNETTSTPNSLAAVSRATSTMSKNDTAGYFNPGTNPGNTQKYVYGTNTRTTLGVDDGFGYSESSNNQGA